MVTFILPGFSIKNKEWLEETAKNIKFEGQIRPIYWDHWDDDSQKFNSREKADLIVRHAKGEKISIIAKSIGTLVAALVVQKLPEQINKVILCGIPVNDLSEEEVGVIKKSSDSLKDNVIIIQNDKDPHGTFDQIEEFNNKVSKPAEDHNYPYYADFQKFLNPQD